LPDSVLPGAEFPSFENMPAMVSGNFQNNRYFFAVSARMSYT
jgi:hypothetical protein